MPEGDNNTERKNSSLLRPIYDKIQSAAPSKESYSEFVQNLKINGAIDEQGHTYRDMIRGILQQKYNENPSDQDFAGYIDSGIQEEEALVGHPVFTSGEEMMSFISNKQSELDAQQANNPMGNFQLPEIVDHGGDPYMGYYPDGTPVDGQPLFDLSKMDPNKPHEVFLGDVKRQEQMLTPSPNLGMGSQTEFPNLNMDFMRDNFDKKTLGSVSADIFSEINRTNPEKALEVQKELTALMDAGKYDPVAVGDYLKGLQDQGLVDPNTDGFQLLLQARDAADPVLKKQRDAELQGYSESAEHFVTHRDEAIKKAEKLKEIERIETEIFGGVEMSYAEKAMLADELSQLNSEIANDQRKLQQIRDRAGDMTIGMGPEEKMRYQAEERVVDTYRQEWKDVLNVYGISPYSNERMKDLEFKKEVGADIEQSLGSYLKELEGMDYEQFVQMSGKSKQDLLRDYAYKRFWPEFKQKIRNYDPGKLTAVIGDVFGDLSESANIYDVYQALDHDSDESSVVMENARRVSELESTGGEPEEKEVRDMIEKAVLLYYMAEEGKDPTTFFGQGDSFNEAGLVGTMNPVTGEAVSLNPVTQPILRGAHEMSMGAFDLVGLEGTKTAGATIRDDLKRKSVVSGDVMELLSNAGIETPENIRTWSKPSSFERIQDITTDVSRLASEFLVTEIATGGLGTPGALAKLGEGVNVMAKGTSLAKTGVRTEAALTRLAGELSNQVKMLNTVAETGSPMARFWAKRTLQGGNAIKEGIKYEMIGRAFKDDAIDFQSGVAGYYGKSLVNSFFPKITNEGVKKKILDFFGKGTGEVTQETMQEISQQGFDKFLKLMSDPEERNWFLATSFVLGGVMGGPDSKIQDMALLEYKKMTPDQKAKFDDLTGRVDFKRYSEQFQDTVGMSDFGKEIRERLNTTPNRMTPEQRAEITDRTDSETDRVLGEFDFDVNETARQSIIQKNRDLIMRGQDTMDMDGMVNELSKPVDVSGNYNADMTSEQFTDQVIEDINSAGYQDNNVYDQIAKMPDGPDKDFLMSEFKAKESERKALFDQMLGKINEDVTPTAQLNIDPTQAQGRGDRFISRFNPLRQAVQDKQVYLKRFQDRIKKAGGVITDATNTYDLFSLAKGKMSYQSEQIVQKVLDPDMEGSISNRVNKIGDDKEFGKLLYALNAKEKNAQIRKKHGNDTDKDSGMTDQEADSFVQKMKDEGKYDAYMEIEGDFRSTVIDPILKEKYDAGIISRDDYDAMSNTYDYYVPTKVDKSKLGYENASYIAGKDGFTSKGFKELEGGTKVRYDDRHNPFYRAAQDRMTGLIATERNNGVKSFADMIRNNGLDQGTDAKFKVADKSGVTSNADTVEFFENGQRMYLEIKDPKLLEAVKNVDIRDPYVQNVLNGIGRIVKFKRMTSTSRNPSFVIPNFLRDTATGYFRLESLGIDASLNEYRKALGSSLRNYRKAAKQLAKGQEPTTEYGKMLKEMKEQGAITTYADFANLDSGFAELETKMEDYKKGKVPEAKLLDFTTKWVENISEIGEVGVRAAVYDLAKQKGMSPQQAAVAAREVTMNFDRKGKLSYITNMLWMFSNAGVQGSYNLAKTLQTSKKARAMAVGTFVTAIAVRMLNETLKTDENEDDSIYEFDKERNLTFLNPLSEKQGDYFKVPVPQGLDMIKYMGDITYDLLNDKKDPGEAMALALKKLSSTVNPLDAPSFSQALAPTFADPIIQHTTNENYFGGQLYPTDPYSGEKVMAYEKFKNASIVGDNLARGVNRLTGGNKVERGLIDWSPNVWDNYFNFIAGGTGRFYTEALLSISDIVQGDFDADETKVPVVSSFSRTGKPNAQIKTKVYEVRNASSATKMSPDDFNNLQGMLTKLVQDQEMDPKQATKIMKTVYKNQQYVKFAEEHDMTVPEAKDFMKGK